MPDKPALAKRLVPLLVVFLLGAGLTFWIFPRRQPLPSVISFKPVDISPGSALFNPSGYCGEESPNAKMSVVAFELSPQPGLRVRIECPNRPAQTVGVVLGEAGPS